MLPTFTAHRSTGSVANFAPAVSPQVRRRLSSWPPCRRLHPAPGVARHRRACTALRPISARLEPVYLLRGFTRWFLTSTFPSRYAGRYRLTVPTRPVVVRAAPTQTGVSRPRLPSASPACCDRPGMKSSHLHPVKQRLVAHEVPDPSPEPDPEDAADATRAGRATHPRLRPARHHHLVRRA